ncbi:tyrosine-specific transport protein 1-like isoform X2 [Cucumis melo var. makuwa]|uniref:Tyrosine-specific transport protein 1-like isoform X2 n=1 Tax=Cucumis melo var. makuwa TaxID=1194695 RepID=A0A5A7T530_CUCMM|nr:tyrosine-specific transport protein 1-like isoform X2 [Cucumis melo var. makuwa]
MEVISVRTMAQETLGDFGGTLATVTYVFLGYTSMVAYISKSGEILLQSFNLPSPLSGFLFTLFFSLLISVGRTRAVDQVNQWLTACMIGLLLGIEVLAVQFGGWSAMDGGGDWRKVPTTIPVIIFALVYHDVIPVLCAYLEGDLPRLRVSVLLGSIIPLLALLVWDEIALGLLAQADQLIDPVELLLSVKWSGISYMVEWFSLLAVGTSMLGTLLSFSAFFKEQLSNIFSDLSTREALKEPPKFCLMKNWWEMHKLGLTALAIAVGPSLLVSTTNPDSFSAATDIAVSKQNQVPAVL